MPLPPKEPLAQSHEDSKPSWGLGPGLASRGLKEGVLLLPHEDGYRLRNQIRKLEEELMAACGKSTAKPAVLRAFWSYGTPLETG